MLLYPDDTVDIGCKQQVVVDNTMDQYKVLVDNKMNYVVHNISNYDPVLFH